MLLAYTQPELQLPSSIPLQYVEKHTHLEVHVNLQKRRQLNLNLTTLVRKRVARITVRDKHHLPEVAYVAQGFKSCRTLAILIRMFMQAF